MSHCFSSDYNSRNTPCANAETTVFLKKIGQPRPLFYLFLSFQTHITILHQFKEKNVMTIQYTALGFELITFET